jgi:hypothetical protein
MGVRGLTALGAMTEAIGSLDSQPPEAGEEPLPER